MVLGSALQDFFEHDCDINKTISLGGHYRSWLRRCMGLMRPSTALPLGSGSAAMPRLGFLGRFIWTILVLPAK